ncbi:hypothetical protein GW17_00037178 [Ensete ventricosum]|nr:hypothetical protein GW17_00037178 [Ensete ventricosum]RZS05801.1 hypothetical protein BHM03_00036391 [Ensete ventricosum]
MFYSHTFLAKKSPLGTVWIAAHLERRIKKPQIDAIDIPSYADNQANSSFQRFDGSNAQEFPDIEVLKNYGLIDVRQEEAYGDILISPMPSLLTAKFE